MSISKRFVSMLKSNLNSLLDKTAAAEGGGADGGRRLEDLSDSELEAELQRRQARREAAQEAARRAAAGGGGVGGAGAGATRPPRGADAEAWQEVEDTLRGSRYRTTGRRPSRSYERVNRRRTSGASSEETRLARLYAQLECPYGADMDVVRKQYRIMMRKYHPDMHSGDAEKQRLATELSQRLTQAYNDLRRSLSGP